MLENLEKKIKYKFKNKSILENVFIHSSYANEKKVKSNERIEFLGDAVLELAISTFLYSKFKEFPEGELTKLRASIVCEKTLAKNARRLELGRYIKLSRGEKKALGNNRDSILSDCLESLIGAIYLDGGIESSNKFIYTLLKKDIIFLTNNYKKMDYKTMLQEIIQEKSQVPLVYKVKTEKGPDHNKSFEIEVYHNDIILGVGKGVTKKAGEQEAAKKGIAKLNRL